MGTRKSGRFLTVALAFVLAFGLIASSAAAQPPEMVKVLISFDRQPGPAEEGIVRGVGGGVKYTYHLVPAIAASIPEAAIQGLLRNPRVTSIEPDITVYAIDAELDNAWGVKHIGAGTVHDGGNRGAEMKIAIIDSGIDYTHPDLDANYDGGYDFVNDDTDPMDDYGHGTHVAGTVAAEDDGVGVVGVAPEARIYALKVLGADGSGLYSDVIAALQWARDNGIQVTNNSYGSSDDPGDTVKAAFDNSYAAGVLHVAAAGNSGIPPGKGDSVIYPARWESVIAVAATDEGDKRARWSSTGADLELAAPGVDIYSTLLGGGYGEKDGTSMASPHVAGTAALVMVSGAVSDTDGLYGIANEVRERLSATADDLGDAGWDPKYGYGLVDADEAAPSGPVNNAPTVSITSPADGSPFDSGATILFEGTASDTEDGGLTAGLVWTSDLEGQIGTGGSFATTLSDGSHTITASVTDSGGKTGSASVSITVGAPSGLTTISVASITYATDGGRNSDRHLLITVALVDDVGDPVADASVSIDVYLDGSLYGTRTGTTGTDGTVTFKANNAPSGTYTTIVTDVTADGLTWDGITPNNGFTK